MRINVRAYVYNNILLTSFQPCLTYLNLSKLFTFVMGISLYHIIIRDDIRGQNIIQAIASLEDLSVVR